MAKLTKTQLLREKMQTATQQSKQTTLDTLPKLPKRETRAADFEKKKRITITGIDILTKEDELALKIGFRLFPSRNSFSKITADLYFDEQKIDSLHIRTLQGPLATDASEFTSVLSMKGIGAGLHSIKIEMYELWSSGEKLCFASKEVTVDYVPVRREDRLIKVPLVKSVAGADLEVFSNSEQDIYREIEENEKKELSSKRDYW